jgi:triacylglycerol lipase
VEKIKKIGFRNRSLFFAKLSAIAYNNTDKINTEMQDSDFELLDSYDVGGSQAFSFVSENDLVIACRGTEATCFSDLSADLRAWPKKTPYSGRVHSGFDWHVSKIWPEIVKDLKTAKEKNLDIWFTGHSLGAAMATILASKCRHDKTLPDPIQVYTYGSPRVGWRKYVNDLSVNHVRWVNNNDAVTYVPPALFGYKHHGNQYYMNAWGNVRNPSGWQKIKDKFRGIIMGWKNGSIDSFADHSISRYVENLERYADNMEAIQYPLISKKST